MTTTPNTELLPCPDEIYDFISRTAEIVKPLNDAGFHTGVEACRLMTYYKRGYDHPRTPAPSVMGEAEMKIRGLVKAYEARCNDKYTAEEVNGKIRGLVDSCVAILTQFNVSKKEG